jgi:hypothetical protein
MIMSPKIYNHNVEYLSLWIALNDREGHTKPTRNLN